VALVENPEVVKRGIKHRWTWSWSGIPRGNLRLWRTIPLQI